MRKPIWLRTDELTESVKALEAFYSNIRRVNGDPYYWKWAVIALHNAVQGFMVCALRGSNNLAVLTPESAKEWMDAYRVGKPYPEERLDDFLNLYKKIKGHYMHQYAHSGRFVPKGQQGWSIKKLNSFRNEFIHFVPRGWSIEVGGFPKICADSLDIVEFLVNSSGNICFHNSRALEKRCQNILTLSKQLLGKIRRAYNS